MRFKVELNRSVSRFLKYECNATERVEFSALMRRLGEEPIKHSMAFRDPEISRFMIRRARFGSCVVVFNFDRARTKVRIRKCQRLAKNQLAGDAATPKGAPDPDQGSG